MGNDQNVSNAFICGYKICNLLYWFSAINDEAITVTLPSFSRNLSKMSLFYSVSVMAAWVRMPWILWYFLSNFSGKAINRQWKKFSLSILRISNNWMKRGTYYSMITCRYQYTVLFSSLKVISKCWIFLKVNP